MTKLKFFLLLLLVCLGSSTVFAQVRYPKREFRGAWIQCVNGQFQGMSTAQMQRTLIQQLDNLQQAGINAIIFRYVPRLTHCIVRRTNLGAVS